MRRVFVLAAFALALVAVQHGPPPTRVASASAAEGDHRAGVVVDLGNGEWKSACVVFKEASITGLDALRAAQMDPVVKGYSGQGGAVCKLCGVGCDPSACFTCANGKYWQYWRAASGSTSYSYSQAGAGSTQVHDGDVEGWAWGDKQQAGHPPYVSVDDLCTAGPVYVYTASASSTTTSPPAPPESTTTTPGAPAASTTTTAAKRGAPLTTTTANTAAAGTAATTSTSTTDPAASATTTVLASSTTAPAAGSDDHPEVAASRAADRRPSAAGDGGSPVGFVAFVLLIGGLMAATVRARARRRRLAD